jgi:hypothetical protein
MVKLGLTEASAEQATVTPVVAEGESSEAAETPA